MKIKNSNQSSVVSGEINPPDTLETVQAQLDSCAWLSIALIQVQLDSCEWILDDPDLLIGGDSNE